ncbi:excisionase family DNA-binding protein [Thermodesulfobacteriota bacterium]
MTEIMTTRELAHYLKLHEITICKLASQAQLPAFRLGRVWRFDKELIDIWLADGQKKHPAGPKPIVKVAHKLRKKIQQTG